MTAGRGGRRLVPSYLATGGRARPSRNTLDQLSVINAASGVVPEGLDPPQLRLLELLAGGALSLAEAAAYLRLPVSVTKVLVSDLVDAGHLIARAPIPAAQKHDRQILERLLSGLRAIR
ncbi:DUF742 domain-containing protein [Streptomyces sp. NBC_01537]|jgi:hypothetical protein|uniref:DUF742 domain-containing protein n=1 Tax=Streptomyces sp. NBC_01537 TaxID=2903896 RepID=UPI00386450CD